MRRQKGTVIRHAGLAVLLLSAACMDRPRDVAHKSDTGVGPSGSAATPDTVRSQLAATCVAVEPSETTLRGIASKQQRLGAPGYGETPKLDKKDTIIVLHLSNPITVCADSSADPRQKPVSVADVQLTGHVDDVMTALGVEVTVKGTLFRAELAWHYTPVVLRVERVVSPSKRRSTSA